MFLFIKEDECKYKPELAAAFVKNVVNITAVSQVLQMYQEPGMTMVCSTAKKPKYTLHIPTLLISHSKRVLLLQYDEKGMEDAVATHNPVSFAFEVTSDFMHYSSGVYSR